MFEEVEVNSTRWLSLENLPNEKWKDIKGFESLYQISDYGRVKSLKRHTTFNRILNNNINKKNGYCYVSLSKNGKLYYKRVHRLVAQTFIPNPDNLPQINHKDQNKHNNKSTNLEWCTPKYNCNYGDRNKRMVATQRKKVIQYDLNHNVIKIWDSLSDIKRVLDYSISHISQCCNGYRKTANKYIWKYMEGENGVEI